MDAEVAIKRLAREVDAAYDEEDSARMAGYWTEDGLNINPFGDRFEGRANIDADLREGLDGFMKDSKHELTVSHVAALDEQTAVADGTVTIQASSASTAKR